MNVKLAEENAENGSLREKKEIIKLGNCFHSLKSLYKFKYKSLRAIGKTVQRLVSLCKRPLFFMKKTLPLCERSCLS